MATSPPAPYSISLPNPKKRLSMSQTSSTSKRPRNHPLRQTSFPAESAALAYGSGGQSAISESGSVAPSSFSAASVGNKPQPRGRGRPRKSQVNLSVDDSSARDGASRTGRNAGAKSVISMRSGAGDGADEDAEDENDMDELVAPDDPAAQKEEDSRQMARIIQLQKAMSRAQESRYDAYRGSGLKESVVRRIVNQTVSQSVGKSQVDAVKFYSKQFAMEIIERARDVQSELAEAYDRTRVIEKEQNRKKLSKMEQDLQADEKIDQSSDEKLSAVDRLALLKKVNQLKEEVNKYAPNKHRGGLLPDHLREALRRYKSDGDGNGVGFDGLSHPLLGVQGSGAWRVGDGTTGHRLFR